MRGYYYVRQKDADGKFIDDTKLFENAQIPEYQTLTSAGADFFCAEEVVIPSIWSWLFKALDKEIKLRLFPTESNIVSDIDEIKKIDKLFSPTLIHTGIKANMEEDEVLEIYNRSSNPKKLGLILANSVGVIDSDYYNNTDNDGEIMFAYYNLKPWSVTIKVGDRIGQGVFKKFLRPVENCRVKDSVRTSGFGSTDNTKI